MNDRSYVAQALFRYLEHYEVAYCVAGDTRQYPDAIPSDIDIVVPGRIVDELPRLIARFCRELGVQVIPALPRDYFEFIRTQRTHNNRL